MNDKKEVLNYISYQHALHAAFTLVGLICILPVAAQDYDKTQQVQEVVVVGNNPQTDNLLLPPTC